ncbi:hypothetical protein TNCT_105011 [Trichonephila clavata]|uniref:Uncharacterized protein n=1 Tax=Trichonephila clavata TaxID=2740835 RepID=A0A8X6HH83_TRICU|nr:hypothetical protein TNCT_105011 [Trichonephila clavata]
MTAKRIMGQSGPQPQPDPCMPKVKKSPRDLCTSRKCGGDFGSIPRCYTEHYALHPITPHLSITTWYQISCQSCVDSVTPPAEKFS